jgi:PKD repeat protein
MVGNGPSVDRLARVMPGGDYGWTGLDTDMLIGALYTWTPSHAPVNLAFTQPETFGGSGFPAEKMDHAFVTESGPTWATGPQPLGKRISEFVLDAAGGLVAGPTPLVEYDGVGKATACGLTAGPDGLYFTDLYRDVGYASAIDRGANVLRVRFVGVADFTTDVDAGEAPLFVRFTDTSTVPSASAWRWEFGDGRTSTARNPTHVYAAPGHYAVRLRVTGPAGTVAVRKADLVRVGSSELALAFSLAPDRSAPAALSRARISGPIHVFLPARADVEHVTFQLDGGPRRADDAPPFDLLGGGPGGAVPLDTARLVEGAHVVRAVVALADGTREAVVAGFTVDNHPCTSLLDVDGDGMVSAATDCVYTARRRLGLSPVPASFRVTNPAIAGDGEVGARTDSVLPFLDLDGRDGVQVVADLTYAVRWLLGLPPVPASYRREDPTLPPDAAIAGALGALVPPGCAQR